MKKKKLLQITDEQTANIIMGMIEGDTDPREVSDNCDRWVRQCYNEPSRDEQIMEAANELLGTYGVEGWCTQDGSSGTSYCNAGDTYDYTLFLVRGSFRVTCLGNVRSAC